MRFSYSSSPTLPYYTPFAPLLEPQISDGTRAITSPKQAGLLTLSPLVLESFSYAGLFLNLSNERFNLSVENCNLRFICINFLLHLSKNPLLVFHTDCNFSCPIIF